MMKHLQLPRPGVRRRSARPYGAVLTVAAVLALAAATASTAAGAAGSTTTVTAPGSGSGRAQLTGVTVASGAGVDRVVFTFAGPALPGVQVSNASSFQNTAGQPVTVAGNAALSVRFFPASEWDAGERCQPVSVAPGPGETSVGVGFTCKNATPGPWPAARASRNVPSSASDAVVAADALEQLLGGPTAAEQSAGFSSPFSAATAGTLLSATIQPGGLVVVDLNGSLATTLATPSAATADQILRGLDATLAIGYPSITSAEYRLGGSCAAFSTWLGLSACTQSSSQLNESMIAKTYTGPDRVTGTALNVTEAVHVDDFESVLVWGIGLRSAVSATVTVDAPARQVIVEVPQTAPTTTTTAPVVTATPRFTG